MLLYAASTLSLPPPLFVKLSLEAVTRNNVIIGSFNPFSFRIFGSARGRFFRGHDMHQFPCEPKTIFKIFRTRVCITRCQPRVSGGFCLLQNCLKQGFIPQDPTFRVPEVYEKDLFSYSSSSCSVPCWNLKQRGWSVAPEVLVPVCLPSRVAGVASGFFQIAGFEGDGLLHHFMPPFSVPSRIMLKTASMSSGSLTFGDPLIAHPFACDCRNNKVGLFTKSMSSGEMSLPILLFHMSSYHPLNTCTTLGFGFLNRVLDFTKRPAV